MIMSVQQRMRQDVQNFSQELTERLYLEHGITPAAIQLASLKEPTGYSTRYQAIMDRKPEATFWNAQYDKELINSSEDSPAKQAALARKTHGTLQADEFNIQRRMKAVNFTKDNDILNAYLPWWNRLGIAIWNKNLNAKLSWRENWRGKFSILFQVRSKEEREKAILDKKINALKQRILKIQAYAAVVQQHVAAMVTEKDFTTAKEEANLFDNAVDTSLRLQYLNDDATLDAAAKRSALMNGFLKRSKSLLKKPDENNWLIGIGRVTALLVSILQGLITFYFATEEFHIVLHTAIALGVFGFIANIFVYWGDIPNTIKEFATGKIIKGFNEPNKTVLTLKKISVVLFLAPAIGVGVAMGFSTYNMFITASSPLMHWKIFAVMAGAFGPHGGVVLAILLATILGVAISCNIHRAFADALKQNKERALIRYFAEFFHPPKQGRVRFYAEKVLTLVLAGLGLAVAGMATYSLLGGWQRATAEIGKIPGWANIFVVYFLAGISRIPFAAKSTLYIMGTLKQALVAAYDRIRHPEKFDTTLWQSVKKGASFSLKHPVLIFGLVGALPYGVYRLVTNPKRFWYELKAGLKTLWAYPWVAMGAIGALAVTVGNAVGNFYISNPETSTLYERVSAAILSFEICTAFFVAELKQYVHQPVDNVQNALFKPDTTEAEGTTETTVDSGNIYKTLTSTQPLTKIDGEIRQAGGDEFFTAWVSHDLPKQDKPKEPTVYLGTQQQTKASTA